LHDRIRHDIFVVSAAKLLNGAASFLIRVYIVRFLDPAAYGVMSFGLNCLMLFDALAGSALDLATMALLTGGKPCEGAEIRPVEKASIRLKLAAGAALVVLMGFSGEWLGYRFLHAPGGRGFFLVLTLGGTCILLVRSAQLYFQARMRFLFFGAIDIIHSALRVLLVGFVLYLGAASAISILGCYAVAAATVAAICFVYGSAAAGWRKVRPGWSDGRALLRSSGPILASVGVSSIVSRLDVFLLALRSNPVQLGLYSAALTIATIPEILGAYLSPVFLPRILPACKAGTFRGLFRRFHLATYAVLGALLVLAFGAGKQLLSLLLPVTYQPSIMMVLILIPGTLAVASFFPLTLNFLLMLRPRIFLIVDSVAAPIVAAAYFFLVPAHGALAAAWITCVHRLVKAAIVQSRAYALARRPLECGAAQSQ
jgi:O-antigen/teichoic acid export membrane protein